MSTPQKSQERRKAPSLAARRELLTSVGHLERRKIEATRDSVPESAALTFPGDGSSMAFRQLTSAKFHESRVNLRMLAPNAAKVLVNGPYMDAQLHRHLWIGRADVIGDEGLGNTAAAGGEVSPKGEPRLSVHCLQRFRFWCFGITSDLDPFCPRFVKMIKAG